MQRFLKEQVLTYTVTLDAHLIYYDSTEKLYTDDKNHRRVPRKQ